MGSVSAPERLALFDIALQRCPRCGGGQVKIIAAILERAVIGKILTHLGREPQPPPRSKAREVGHGVSARQESAVIVELIGA